MSAKRQFPTAFLNGAGRADTPCSPNPAEATFPTPFPTPTAFANPALLSTSVLDGMDTLLVVFGGQNQSWLLFEVTKLFQAIDPDATITNFSAGPAAGQYVILFFLVKNNKNPEKLADFRLALEERCRDIPRNLPPVPAGRPRRFTVFAPDSPGVLFQVCGKLKAHGLNIAKLVGEADVRDVDGKFVPFCELRFKVAVPAGKEEEFKAFLDEVRGFAQWEVRLDPRRPKRF